MKKLLNTIIGENKRFMKYIILYCLAFPSLMLLLGYIAIWFDKDIADLMTATKAIFATELVLGIIKVLIDTKKTNTTEKTNSPKSGIDQ